MVTNTPPSTAEIEITDRDILESSMTQRWENFKGGQVKVSALVVNPQYRLAAEKYHTSWPNLWKTM